jgi:hypothetical protein
MPLPGLLRKGVMCEEAATLNCPLPDRMSRFHRDRAQRSRVGNEIGQPNSPVPLQLFRHDPKWRNWPPGALNPLWSGAFTFTGGNP